MNARSQSRFQPPLDFLPVGEIVWARFADNPPAFIAAARSRVRGRKRAGMLYETRAMEYLKRESEYFIPGPWVVFIEAGSARKRWAQPDGLILDFMSGLCTIVEVKLKHTDRAWWQIRRLYTPLLKRVLGPAWRFTAVEIVQHCDPHTPFPESIYWARRVGEIPPDVFAVHQFSGRG